MTKMKPEYSEYIDWLQEKHSINILEQEVIYNSVTTKIKDDFENSSFWKELEDNLSDYNDQYYLENKYHLLMRREIIPEIKIKPFKSFLEKTYRKNILNNSNWPDAPEVGWLLPYQWFSQVNDILRTIIIVKYLDGVAFITNKIDNLSREHNLNCKTHLESRIDGYYAAHQYVKNQFEIPIGIKTKFIDVTVEFQTTTQLQEIIKQLLYSYYAKKRKFKVVNEDWQWDYQSDEFLANNLGHILHYVEGMIMEVREKQR
jgi:hypothetical protein